MTAKERVIFEIAFLIVIFVFLYSVAFISNRHYRDSEDILYISKRQWEAILVMMLPVILAAFIR